ncbi:MAG: FAD-binding protein [Dongiaceae bacterium]
MTQDLIKCDVLVLGSGASGFAAAITAKLHGLETIIAEKASVFGGTSATSGGYLWIPCAGKGDPSIVQDSIAAALAYIKQEAGELFDEARALAYLKHGPEMVDFFERRTEVRFKVNPSFPDYHSEAAGGRAGGRSIWVEPYRGTKLGAAIEQLRQPLREFSFLGMGVSKRDLWHFFHMTSSLSSLLSVVRLLASLIGDRLVFGRSMRLVNGNALIARLARTALNLDIPIWLSAPAEQLVYESGAVRGAILARFGSRIRIETRLGVISCCGGFPQDISRRRRVYLHPASPREHHSVTPPENTGDGLALAESVGAQVAPRLPNAGYWMPVSEVARRDGTMGYFPHTGGVDRCMPGFIAVNPGGRRFCNESTNYHDFAQAMIRACEGEEVRAFLVCDHRAIRKYGLGVVRPQPIPVSTHLRSGYLKRGHNLRDIALQIGVDPEVLDTTVSRFNRHAAEGRDPDFGRGEAHYDRYYGDSKHKPNPSLGPLDQAPFYAITIKMGDVGTLMGLRTDAHARVLDSRGAAIAGLYAAGNDMCSIFGGKVSGAGITLGPGMTFGYIAASHLASSAFAPGQK